MSVGTNRALFGNDDTRGLYSGPTGRMLYAFAGWEGSNSGGKNWRCLAASAYGQYVLAAETSGIYYSSNYGVDFSLVHSDEAISSWYGAAISDDGTMLAVTAGNNKVWISSDSGANWAGYDSAVSHGDIAMSDDGQYMISATWAGKIRISADYGATWAETGSSQNWGFVAMSADGKYQIASIYSSSSHYLYLSSDYGATWATTGSARGFTGVAASNSGQYLSAVVYGGKIYTSSDYGANWTERDYTGNWQFIKMSGDGQYQFSGWTGSAGVCYRSIDYGVTWTACVMLSYFWSYITISDSGRHFYAAAYKVGSMTPDQMIYRNRYFGL